MKSTLVTLVVLLSSGMVGCVSQSSGLYDGATTVTVENDTFTGSDSNYTNGLGVSWASNDLDTYDPDSFVPRWGKFWSFLPFVSNDGYDTYASWSVAQEMNHQTISRTRLVALRARDDFVSARQDSKHALGAIAMVPLA